MNISEMKFRNVHIHMVGLEKEVDHDTRERKAVEESLICYLRLAIESYGLALSCCGNAPTFTKHVFRLISLWFKNSHRVNDKENINSTVATSLDKIPRCVKNLIASPCKLISFYIRYS